MKTKLLAVFVFAGFATGCQYEGDPLRIFILPASKGDCLTLGDPVAGPFQTGGVLDVGAGSPAYFVQLGIVGADRITQRDVTVAGQTIESTQREAPVIDRVVFNYKGRGKSPLTGFREESFAVRGAFSATSPTVVFNQNVLGPNASLVIDKNTPVYSGPDDVRFLDVIIEARAHMSGSGAQLSTGQVTFPLSVVKSDLSSMGCTNGFQLCPNSVSTASPGQCCLYVGQDDTQRIPACCGTAPGDSARCRVP